MVHLRIVAPSDRSEKALELLNAYGSVSNVIFLKDAAHRPDGDVILCVTHISDAAERAERFAPGSPADAVV